MKLFLSLAVGLAISLVSTNVFAQLSYDEQASGDLSGLFGSPTSLTLGFGVNTITGDVGSTNSTGATNGTDADFFSFMLGAGESVDSITVTRSLNTAGNGSFLGYSSTGFTDLAGGGLDANTIFSNGDSILPGVINTPLGAGTHYFWIQETGGQVDYSISLNLTAVPEPSSAIALAGLGILGFLRRRR